LAYQLERNNKMGHTRFSWCKHWDPLLYGKESAPRRGSDK